MAEDFLPVGVRAVVENVENFIADMGRMERAVRGLGQAIRETGADVDVFGKSTSRAEEQSRGFDSMLQRMSQHEQSFGDSTQRLSQRIEQLVISLRGHEPAMNRFTASLTRAREAQAQNFGSLDRLRNKISELTAARSRESQQLAAATARYTSMKGTIETLGETHSRLEKRLKQARDTQGGYNIALGQASRAFAKAKADLATLTQEIQRNEKFGASAAQIAQQFSAKEMELKGRINETRASIHNLNMAMGQNSERMGRLRNALATVSGMMGSAKATTGIFRNEMLVAGGSVNQLGIRITGLALALGAVSVVMGITATAVTAAKAAFTLLKTAILSVAKAVGLASTLFIGFFGAIKGINDRVGRAAKLMFRWGNSIRFLGTSITFLVSLPIIGFLGTLAKSAIDFEEAFAGVIKTVDRAEFRLIKEGSTNVRDLTIEGRLLERLIRDLALEIPISAIELAKLGEVAGTLGITGVPNLEAFIRTAALLGVTTDVAGEDAARSLAKILSISGGLTDAELATKGFSQAQIDGLTKSERFQESVESLGGILVALGNKTPGIESTILDMTKQMSATSDVLGITTASTFALASSFDSTGATAVRAKTTYQNVMFAMLNATKEGGESLEIFAKTSGVTVEEFVNLFQRDAATAFLQFTEGLGIQGDDAVTTLQALDLADNRVMQTILSLANAEGVLREQLGFSTQELEAQRAGVNALEQEAAKRFSTTQSQLTLLKNQFSELGISIKEIVLPPLNRLIGYVRLLLERISELDPELLRIIITILALVAMFGPLVTAVGLGMATFGFLIGTIATVIGAILGLITSIGLLAFPIIGVIAAVIGLAIAFAASFSKMERFAGTTAKTLTQKMFEFGSGIILAFARGMAKALVAIIMVLNAIGQVIAKWLKPGSPPKLLPDLDKWGSDAMLVYMEGWASADFGVFNKIADKIEGFMRSLGEDVMPKDGLVSRILGTRKEIASAINQIKKVGKVTEDMLDRVFKAMGGTSNNARAYVRALLDVAAASEKVKEAQEAMAKITESYANALKPLSKRLAEISKRQEEVSNAMRIGELEEILADPRASELVRELANLELEQIGLEGDVSSLEATRDIELEREEAKLAAAEAELKAASAILDASEALLDVQTKNNQLVNEMIQAVEKLGGALGGLGEGGIGDIAPGFDPDSIPDPDDINTDLSELLDFSALETSISDSIAGINTEFLGLITELKAIFAPLEPLWEELGTTWSPIIEEIILFIQDLIPVATDAGTSMEEWQTKVEKFAEKLKTFLDTTLYEFFAILVDLGLIQPFGPLVEDAEAAEGPLSRIGQTIESVKQFFRDLKEDVINAYNAFLELALVEMIIDNIGALIESLKGPFENLMSAFRDFGGSLARIAQRFKDVWERSTALRALLAGIVKVIVGFVLIVGRFLQGILAGIIGGVVEGLGNAIRGIGIFFEGLVGFFTGFTEIISGIVGFVKAIFQGIFGQGEEGGRTLIAAWESIKNGILGVVGGLVKALLGLFATVFGAIWGLVSGFVEGVVNFFRSLFNKLVGHSIVTDLVNGILALFEFIFIEIPRKLAEFILGFISLVAQFVLDVLASIGQFILDAIAFFATLFLDILTAIGTFILDAIAFFATLFLDILTAIGTFALEAIAYFATLFLDILTAIGTFVLDAIAYFGTLFLDILAAIGTFVLDAIAFFGTLFFDILAAIGQFVLDAIAFFGTLFLDILAAIGQFTLDAIAFFGTLFLDILTAIGQFVLDVVAFFIQLPLDILAELGLLPDGVGGIIEDVVAFFTDLVTDIPAALISLPGELFAKGVEIVQGLIDGVKSLAGNAVDSVVGVGEDILGGIGDFFGISSPSREMEDIGEDVMGGWISGVKNQTVALLSIFREMAQAITELVGAMLKEMTDAWTRVLGNLLPYTANWVRAMVMVFTEMGTVIFVGGNSIIAGWLTNTEIMWDEMLRVALDWVFDMQVLLSEFFWDTLDMFEELIVDFRKAGQALMIGFQLGIELGAEGVWAAARAVANGVKDIMDTAFDYGSPSKVFMEYGADQMKGWSMGIDNASSEVLASIADVAGELAQQATQAMPAPRSAMASQQAMAPVQLGANATTVTNAEVNMGGQQINNGMDAVMLQIVLEQALRNILY